MRFIHADCEAQYSGRGETLLPRCVRIICIKDDDSIQIIARNGVKPLNYMGAKSTITITEEGDTVSILAESSKEYLLITCHQVFSSWSVTLPVEEPGLIHDGTEDQLQSWLHDNLHMISTVSSIKREFETGNGPVDILGDCDQGRVLVEVKRTATTAAIHQVRKYVEGSGIFLSMIVALDVRPSARNRAVKYGIPWMQLQRDEQGYSVQEVSDDFPFLRE